MALAVEGQIFVSQHIGDLEHFEARQAFRESIADLTSMYEIDLTKLIVAHDLHPEYASSQEALELEAASRHAVQHHRAHIASVLAEREAWEQRVLGVSFDGTGYGDDGTIWGGEFFAGSLAEGFERVMHLRPAVLPGGDAAARFPVQAAAGFLAQLDGLPDLTAPPFSFPERYELSQRLASAGLRAFSSTSVGRLFDAAAALLGFTRAITFEGQAAIWLEQLARRGQAQDSYPFPMDGANLDFRPLLDSVISDRLKGRDPEAVARAFSRGIAGGVTAAIRRLCEEHSLDTAVLSGGVFQNDLLLADIQALLAPDSIHVWTNSLVPPNDGGISLGQAAMAAFQYRGERHA